MEVVLLSLHSQLYQLETQQAQLTSAGHHDEGTMLQLVMEISALQQQVSHVTSHDESHDLSWMCPDRGERKEIAFPATTTTTTTVVWYP